MTHQRAFSSNGVGGRRSRSDTVHRSDVANWRSGAAAAAAPAPVRSGYPSHVTSNSSSPPSSGRPPSVVEDEEFHVAGSRGGAHDNPVHGRLLFLTMCLVGQFVEVQLKDGSVYSGIFHTANVDKDFGVVLKMARLTKEATGKAAKSDAAKQAARKPPMKLLIVYAKDLVQIVAKDVLLTGEAFPNGRSRENRNELLTDSYISQSRRDTERELKPWKPDADAPRNLGLESTFQNSWNRNWDQFETNKTLFGVQTTFDEELYTTKLEKGPQTREREKEALRLAREIEGETTRSTNAVEERGSSDAELDEESKYSSVLRPRGYEDEGEDNIDDKTDNFNEETFGASAVSSENIPSTVTQDSASPPHGPAGSPRSSALTGDALNLNSSSSPASEEIQREREPKSQESVKKPDPKTFNEKERSVKNFDGRLPRASSTVKLADDIKPTPTDKKPSTDGTSKNLTAIAAPPASALPLPVGLNSGAASVVSSSGSSRSPNKSPSLETPREDAEPSVLMPASTPVINTAAIAAGIGTVKKLNSIAKQSKLNPDAQVFTPSTKPASPFNQQSQIFVPAAVPVSPMQAMPIGMGFMQQQQGQPAQYTQYNSTMAATGVTAAPYIQPSTTFVPGSVPPMKLPPQTQPQVTATPYGQQQTMRYMPPMQTAPAYPHPNYPQQVIYGQHPFVYIHQYPQGMMQGQPLQMPLPQQPPSSQLTQGQKHLGGEGAVHHNAPNALVGQSPVQSPLQSPVPRPQAAAAAAAPSSASTNAQKAGSGGGLRGGNKT